MLVELAIIIASCDVNGAALGACVSQCPRFSGASYTMCAERGQTSNSVTVKLPSPSAPPKPKPMRLCPYYVNGTINIPTASVITAWVEVGSRSCIGDPEPEPRVSPPATRTAEEITMEVFTAHAVRPFAYLSPSGEVEITEIVNFGVSQGGGEHLGQLFGAAATIRFVAVGISWSFSDGQRLSGQFVSTSFDQPRQLTAVATVQYRIDYLRAGGSWVFGAASASLDSNRLSLSVIDPPRRTLLVG